MSNVESLKSLNLELPQQLSFVRYYRNLPPKSSTTIRFFNRVEYFTVHGEDAKLAAEEVFKSSAHVKTMGQEPLTLDYLCLSKANFEKFVRELLLVKQYRCEVYVNQGSTKNNDWILEYKGSPGNLQQFEEVLFDNNDRLTNTIVVAVKLGKDNLVGVSAVDANERIFHVCEFIDNEFFSNLESVLVQIGPNECLICQSGDSEVISKLETILKRSNILCSLQKKMEHNLENLTQDLDRLINFQDGQQKDSKSLQEINFTNAMAALSSVIKYLDLISDEYNFDKFTIKVFDPKRYVHLDSSAMFSMNILPREPYEAKNHNLLGLLNHCRTPQGRRLLAQWIKQPLRDMNAINDRLDIVQVLMEDSSLRNRLYNEQLRRIPDLLMLSKKIMKKKGGLQECYKVYQGIDKVPYVISALKDAQNKTVTTMFVNPFTDLMEDMQKFQQMVETTLDMDLVDKGEFLIKPSFDSELEELASKKQEMEEKINVLLGKAARDLSLDAGKTVKIDYTSQHNYFFRVTLKEEQTLRENKSYRIIDAVKGGVRFTNDKLDRYNETYTDIKCNYKDKQKAMVDEILSIAAGYANTISNLNYLTAQLDVLISFAVASSSAPIPYIRPNLHPENYGSTVLKQIRHPLIEIQDGISFNPNDVEFSKENSTLHIITGLNMGGKSTYIRSVGMAVLMAQIGCFVPCEQAEISLFDSILSRVGSDDCQAKGLSTFMLEMVETAAVIRMVTENSLVIIDELGRGTSTYEGCGIAWAIAEHLAKDVKACTLFATHFHEITSLEKEQDNVVNRHVSAIVDEKSNSMTLLYQVKPGVCDQSFGIHVAKMVGFSEDFCNYASEIQESLEDFRNMEALRQLDSTTRQKLLHDGDIVIRDALKKCQNLNSDNMSEQEIKDNLNKIKGEFLQMDNVYVKTLIS